MQQPRTQRQNILGWGMGGVVSLGLSGLAWGWSVPSLAAPPVGENVQLLQQLDPSPTPVLPRRTIACPTEVTNLLPLLLRDLPSYANRVNFRAMRRDRTVASMSYVILASPAEWEQLSLGPGTYTPLPPSLTPDPTLQQVFFTTLERQYTPTVVNQLQHYHWVFLTATPRGWRLSMMFSQIGNYPDGQPPSPPRDSAQGALGQAIVLWLRDCQAGAIRALE